MQLWVLSLRYRYLWVSLYLEYCVKAAIKFTVRFFFSSCKRKGEMLALPPFDFTTADFVGLAYLVAK